MLPRELYFAFKFRRVWWYTATSRTRARFARTVLGSFWLGLTNLLTISALGAVYGKVFEIDDPNEYFVYLGLGLVVWNSLASSIISAPQLFAHNAQNIKNKKLPVIFYVLEEWAFQLQTFIQSFVLVFIVLSFFKFNIVFNFLLYAWLPLLNLILFIYWFPLIVCLISIWFKDLSQLVPVIIQIVFLISPILYQKESLKGMEWIININFIYRILEPIRTSILESYIDYNLCLLILLFNILGIILSAKMIKNQTRNLPFLI